MGRNGTLETMIRRMSFLIFDSSLLWDFAFGEFASYRFDKVNRLPLILTRSREINYGPATTILLVVDEVIKVADAYFVTSVGEEVAERRARTRADGTKVENAAEERNACVMATSMYENLQTNE